MWRNIAANALTVIIVLLVGVATIVAWGQGQYRGEGPLAEAICLRVPQGSNMRRVADDLEGQGAISSASIFRVGADYADKSELLKAGSFRVPPSSSMEEIVDIVTRGGPSTCGVEVVYRIGVASQEKEVRELDPETNRFVVRTEFDPLDEATVADYEAVRAQPDTRYAVVLAEGVTSWQVVEALGGADFLEGDVAELPPEGSLAPERYDVEAGETRADLLADMAALQTERLEEAWRNRADGLPLESPEEALILASIIEKETSVPEERPTVSSVFVNRLNTGMRLQTDPTVIYGVTEGRGTLGRGLRQSELRGATPWNTYVIEGLPPTPIANPGLASIEAALNPAVTEYIFFVADGTGGHTFTTNLADHNRAVARWREIERERAAQQGDQ